MTDLTQPPPAEATSTALMAKPALAVVPRSPDPAAKDAMATEAPDQARVRELAYALYQARGCLPGHDVEDWLAAEAALAAELQSAKPAATPSEG